jgi:hypothetical protein
MAPVIRRASVPVDACTAARYTELVADDLPEPRRRKMAAKLCNMSESCNLVGDPLRFEQAPSAAEWREHDDGQPSRACVEDSLDELINGRNVDRWTRRVQL